MRYLASDRDVDGFGPQACEECMETENHRRWAEGHGDLGLGIPLAKIRGPEGLGPLSVELLGLLVEECGEVGQRVGKVLRWGWDADFAGTTQRHKLEVELGDVLAAMILAIHNDLADECGFDKLMKLREDAAGPRQRLRHARVPEDGFAGVPEALGVGAGLGEHHDRRSEDRALPLPTRDVGIVPSRRVVTPRSLSRIAQG